MRLKIYRWLYNLGYNTALDQLKIRMARERPVAIPYPGERATKAELENYWMSRCRFDAIMSVEHAIDELYRGEE